MLTKVNRCMKAFLGLLLVAQTCFAQSSLWISSPPSGFTVYPNQTVDITVSHQQGLIFESIAIASSNLSFSNFQSGVGPFVFSFTVPASAPIGPLRLLVGGRTADKTLIKSSLQDWYLMVGAPMSNFNLAVSPEELNLTYPGMTANLYVSLRQGDQTIDIGRGVLLFSSTDPLIASVSNSGMIIGKSAGRTVIEVTYDAKKAVVPVLVNASIPGDLDADNDVDTQDLSELKLWLGSRASTPLDARDLIADGVLNDSDVSKLISLCTRTQCSSSSDGKLSRLADTVAPTVRITAPATGSTVRRKISVTAEAGDNIELVGVQFYLDGVPFLAEDQLSPYTISWDTSKSINGTHVLTAVARDYGNNKTSSAPVSVTVTGGLSGPPTPTPTATSTPTPRQCSNIGATCASNTQCCSNRCRKNKCA